MMLLNNSDKLSLTDGYDSVNGNVVGLCLDRVVDVRTNHNLDIEFGQVFAYDAKYKIWFSLFSHHYWNFDKDDNLYDSYSQLNVAFSHYMGDGELKDWKVVELDGDKFKWLKQEPTNDTYQYQKVYKFLNKIYPNNKTADLIYIRNFGYAMPPDHRLIDWETAQLQIDKQDAFVRKKNL